MTTPPHQPVAHASGEQELPATMKAAIRRGYGGPQAVAVETVARPTPGPGELLIRVHAAGLDRATLHLLEGLPYLARLALGVRRPRQPVLGQQVAGEVVAVGEGQSPYAAGDRVFGTARGSFAQFAVAATTTLAAAPDGVDDVDLATVGVSGLTAWDAVVAHGQVQSGQRVLVLGASGAVGSYAVQLAHRHGAEVTAVCSRAKHDFVLGLGARRAVDYRQTPIGQMGGPFEVIVDIAGNRPVSQLRQALTPAGALVIVGGEDGGPILGGIQRNLVASAANRFTRQRLGWLFSRTTTAGCVQLGTMIADGTVVAAVDRRVGLEGAAGALAAMQRGELLGQAVICP